MKVEKEEVFGFTAFRRGLTSVMEKLRAGEIEKAVVTRHGKFECVLLTTDEYEKLKG